MCGICGVLGNPDLAGERTARAMCDRLAHRGPDDCGLASGQGWVLGHRRLSIIDLSEKARQPLVNEAGDRFVVCNGEIYNHAELRAELEDRGHRFASRSDSEVILHLFEEYGPSAVSRMNGMFAFAVLDASARTLMLGRDRMGIKPLYYFRRPNGVFAFASESKALFSVPGFEPRLARDKIGEFLRHRYIAGDETLFEGVKSLMPASILTVSLDDGRIEILRYWDFDRTPRAEASYPEALLALLETSVRDRLMSDVPLGTQLSGGLDSSLVTALAVRANAGPMHTFSVGFDGAAQDESHWAEAVARQLGTHHHRIPYSEQEFIEDLAEATYLNDDPLNHPNSLPMRKLCREAKKEVTVLLTGEGADELFAGYSWHRRLWRFRRLLALSRGLPLGAALTAVAGRTRAARLAGLLGQPQTVAAARAAEWSGIDEIGRLLAEKPEAGHDRIRAGMIRTRGDLLAMVLDMDLRGYLVSVLQRQDRMSMAEAVESRVPFLDHRLVEHACTLAGKTLFAAGQGKAPLRAVAAGLVPEDIILRRKVGFQLPIAAWMQAGRLQGALSLLLDERAGSRGIWRTDGLRELVARHRGGAANHADTLWALLALEIWIRLWVDREPCDGVREGLLRLTGAAPQAGARGSSCAFTT